MAGAVIKKKHVFWIVSSVMILALILGIVIRLISHSHTEAVTTASSASDERFAAKCRVVGFTPEQCRFFRFGVDGDHDVAPLP